MTSQSRREFAVRRSDGNLAIPRFSTHEQAYEFMQDRYAIKQQYRAECEEWERTNPTEGLHPSGTNEPWWRWHRQGWKDFEWRVVVREVTEWRDTAERPDIGMAIFGGLTPADFGEGQDGR